MTQLQLGALCGCSGFANATGLLITLDGVESIVISWLSAPLQNFCHVASFKRASDQHLPAAAFRR
eukprot:5306727-Prymnesium_polylepis.1